MCHLLYPVESHVWPKAPCILLQGWDAAADLEQSQALLLFGWRNVFCPKSVAKSSKLNDNFWNKTHPTLGQTSSHREQVPNMSVCPVRLCTSRFCSFSSVYMSKGYPGNRVWFPEQSLTWQLPWCNVPIPKDLDCCLGFEFSSHAFWWLKLGHCHRLKLVLWPKGSHITSLNSQLFHSQNGDHHGSPLMSLF